MNGDNTGFRILKLFPEAVLLETGGFDEAAVH
jgi:hypothetical protein